MNGMLIDLLGLNKFKLAIKKLTLGIERPNIFGFGLLLTTIENKRPNVFSYLFKQYIIQQETSCS